MNASFARAVASLALSGLCILSSSARAELPQLTATQQVTPTAAEIARDADGQIFFGWTVAIDGNTAMVDMSEYGPGSSTGRVAVFDRVPSGRWVRTATIDSPEPFANFGSTIVLKDDTALIPCLQGICVYRRFLASWVRTTTLTPPSGRPITYGLPDSLKYHNGVVTVGATYTDDFTGTVFVYGLDALGHVSSSTQLFGTDADVLNQFGSNVDFNDQTLVASAHRASTGEGIVLVFQRVDHQWTQTQTITRPVSDPRGGFPNTLALNRDVLLIGDYMAQIEGAQDTPDGHSAMGAVYVFAKQDGTFTYRQRLRPTPDQLFSYWSFGSRIVTDGDRAVITCLEPPSFLYANAVAVVYERQGDQAVATHIARSDYDQAASLSGNRLLLGSPYFVDYDDYSFHLTGWADFYTLPQIGH
jgi:hypothetical protein